MATRQSGWAGRWSGAGRLRSLAAFEPVLVRALPWAVLVCVSVIELALADRKYGLFTGGFGQSRAVDTVPEIGTFLVGYILAQLLVALLGWWLVVRLARGAPAWQAAFLFAIFGAGFLGLLAAQYQLHSYFSDTVNFALLKQLGGGSFTDALLFGLSEIGIGMLVLGGAALGAWIAWRLARRYLSVDSAPARAPGRHAFIIVPVLFLMAAFVIPRGGSDAAHGLGRTLAWKGITGVLDLATDFDGDGYGLFGIQHDSAPFDPARHPLALDIPGNGIDEDGYGGDLRLVPLNVPLPQQTFAADGPNVILVVMESTRADVIGKRIGGRPVAPNLEALVRGGDLATPAYSHVGFTTESLKSVFSGQLAPREGDPSLFRDFAASGYRIGVFSGQPEDFGGISATVGMREKADAFVDAETLRDKRAFDFAAQGSLLVDESHLLDAFQRAFPQEAWTVPHFVYFNFQSPHFPYHHDGVPTRIAGAPLPRGEIAAGRAEEVRATYWNAVANADAWLGVLVARLKKLGVWDNTILLVTGDHGEDLFEDGFLGHGHILNERQYATFLATNRPGILPDGPIALSDYRWIVADALHGTPPAKPTAAPFLHIGSLDRPTAIGLAGPDGQLTSLRLDTGNACLVERGVCAAYDTLDISARRRVDALAARWGSERWRERNRR